VKVVVLTLFPGMFESFLSHSIMKRALAAGTVSVNAVDIRDYAHDKHRTVDDRPFGGGPGMLMKPEPIFEAVDALFGKRPKKKGRRFVYMSPQGKRLDHATAAGLAKADELVVLCGHYEGVDERVVEAFVTDEVSIGDYVLTGGELPAMVLIDTVTRLIPGVLGREESKEFESFCGNLLEYPQYTRPAVYRGKQVPPVLLSGNHKAIEGWRKEEALKRTRERRPDLLHGEEVTVSSKKVKGEGHASAVEGARSRANQKRHP